MAGQGPAEEGAGGDPGSTHERMNHLELELADLRATVARLQLLEPEIAELRGLVSSLLAAKHPAQADSIRVSQEGRSPATIGVAKVRTAMNKLRLQRLSSDSPDPGHRQQNLTGRDRFARPTFETGAGADANQLAKGARAVDEKWARAKTKIPIIGRLAASARQRRARAQVSDVGSPALLREESKQSHHVDGGSDGAPPEGAMATTGLQTLEDARDSAGRQAESNPRIEPGQIHQTAADVGNLEGRDGGSQSIEPGPSTLDDSPSIMGEGKSATNDGHIQGTDSGSRSDHTLMHVASALKAVKVFKAATKDEIQGKNASRWESSELWVQHTQNAYGAFAHVAMQSGLVRSLHMCGPMLFISIMIQAVGSICTRALPQNVRA